MMFAWLGCWFPFKPFKHWERFTNLWEAVLPDAIFFKVAAKERGCFFNSNELSKKGITRCAATDGFAICIMITRMMMMMVMVMMMMATQSFSQFSSSKLP